MNRIEAHRLLGWWDQKGRFVFSAQDLAKLFHTDKPKAFRAGLNRLVRDGMLIRAGRGVYVNPHANSFDAWVLERIARTMRRGEYSYISLESMLSEYGAISQIPVDRLTVMTTGRKGTSRTPYGVIEFTHTGRSVADILQSTQVLEARPLRVATPETAWRDLKRTGRNTRMVMISEMRHG